MHKLAQALRERVSGGLKRKSITTCSQWAEKYRVMGKPYPGAWSFLHHPWLKEMHDCTSESMCGQKSAQMGFTEVALNRSFYTIDIHGESVLYILPASTPDASDFSTSRFDPALELSNHLSKLFSDVKNIGHKRAGSANFFIRGSRSRSQLKSLPVSTIIEDELDEMVQENVALAQERTSGQVNKSIFKLSTPTIDNYGINAEYRQSTQEHFFFKCPSCSRSVELTFPDCLVITSDDFTSTDIYGSHIICPACKNILQHEAKPSFLKSGIWVPTHANRISRGFHINQLYSCTVKPYEIAISWRKAQLNPTDEQEFYNSKLGLTHIVEGARVTDANIDKAKRDHRNGTKGRPGKILTLGVDVGKWLHYEIDEWIIEGNGPDVNLLSTCKTLKHGKCLNFEDLDGLMQDYGINFCCIDANPERRKALEFCQRNLGRARMVFYGNGAKGTSIGVHNDEVSITVDRTSWLDLALGRFKNGKILLPFDVDNEYRQHLKSLVRIYEKDSDGNPVGRYVCGNEDDHYAHARNYSEIALSMSLDSFQNQDISVPL